MQKPKRKLKRKSSATYLYSKRAFSLMEITIVVVIISILLAGVLTVSSLTHTARIQGMIKEMNKIKTAIDLFEQQYDDLPGDMSTAVAVFGATDCPDHATFGNLDCNGDSNGTIGSIYGNDGMTGEHSYVYLHLQLAGLYPGDFTPHTYSGSLRYGVGEENAATFNTDGPTGYYSFWAAKNKSLRYQMNIATIPPSGSSNLEKPYYPALRGVTVGHIDRKIDDGKYNTGLITAGTGMGATCDGSGYHSKNIVCTMYFSEER